MAKDTVTLAKGASGEREVPIGEIEVPNLWHIAMDLNKKQEKVYVLWHGEFTWVLAGDYILECWHLAHDLKRHIEGR